ncbi:hypothetical protein A3J43_02350 [Candidatus Uhrbacteria bacterium RIFCSPHIGHO2_12_FULL_54_23]|uniref:Uncharacterized protein n=3 Tax=Candidatus Uhriibacteriota TaxID=1752732 RepID=A0A1F7UK34_9BACT|nr:MAG: hypothetical protein A3J43_02350 [Candidatus Uhrbacteria bacterium RIFCSPHIGHO2_12_FULL_54_23]OGL84218.1 MAG: hypothetical protein A3B36_01690 [Candidatus Uhrbacteria bacterium RIFCSPLOWO2_01_FULL_55_36]OGL90536.1 MAG: hypothetical protein A3J36_01040 [Candidatus Uhrbacteria bacterium RIFCSPLOWO2_02_FULL_54_37]
MAWGEGNHTERDPGMLQLKLAEYAARHRARWQRGFQFSLFFLDVLILCALAIVYVEYAAGLPAHHALEASLNDSYINFASYHAAHRALPLAVEEIAVVPTGRGRADVVARITNPNRIWAAREVFYQFVTAAGRSLPSRTFVLPGEARVVAAFRQQVRPDERVRVELGETAWRRVDPARVPLLDVRAEGIRYTPLATGATGIDFVAVNATPYSFWAVPLTVVARHAGGVAGVHAITIERWKIGERRQVSLIWPDALPAVRETNVQFAIDILDPSVFMPFEGREAPYPGF